jgi:hypothetical protein
VVNSETDPSFRATLIEVAGKKIATGADFDASGALVNDVAVVDAVTAQHIASNTTNTVRGGYFIVFERKKQ